MENLEKIKELLESMNDAERQVLAEELKTQQVSCRAGIPIEDITPRNLNDPEFSQRVRNEIHSALRGEI